MGSLSRKQVERIPKGIHEEFFTNKFLAASCKINSLRILPVFYKNLYLRIAVTDSLFLKETYIVLQKSINRPVKGIKTQLNLI